MSLGSEIRALSDRPAVRCLALVVLFTGSMRLKPLSSAVLDPDIWWHLRDGDFIIAQHRVPRQGLFTQYSSHSWVDYSWGSEVIMARVYHWFGLMGLVALRSVLELTIAATVFLLLSRGLGSFWRAWPSTAVGMWAMNHSLGMQPMLFSIVAFSFELALLFEALRRNDIRPLVFLPLIFLAWANLHIQFVYGLFVLVLLAAIRTTQARLPESWSGLLQPRKNPPLSQVLAITGLSALATLIGPYSWQLYRVIFNYLRSSALYGIIIELQALNFRAPGHFVFVLVLATAFFVLGWRRSRDPFQLALLTICGLVGFRMTRDTWFSCLPALAIIADRERRGFRESRERPFPGFAFVAVTGVACALMFALVAWDSRLDNRSLERLVAASFPVNACSFVRAHSLPGPIYNDMNWGGFLIWALPEEPVAIDNRPDLYGDAVLSRFYSVQQGWTDWRNDPDLNAAEVVMLNNRTPLAHLLADAEGFHLVYQDPLAAVFTRNQVAGHLSGDGEHRLQKPAH